MKKLIVMCGTPGSGKSTWIKNHLHTFNGYTAVISRDDIRFLLVPEGEEYFSRETEVFRKYIDDIKFSLDNCDVTIADATHLNPASRSKLLRNLKEHLKNVEVEAMVVRAPLNVALAQNEKRQGTRSYVPHSAIRRMDAQFEMPTFEEGFDRIYIYTPEKETKYIIKERSI